MLSALLHSNPEIKVDLLGMRGSILRRETCKSLLFRHTGERMGYLRTNRVNTADPLARPALAGDGNMDFRRVPAIPRMGKSEAYWRTICSNRMV